MEKKENTPWKVIDPKTGTEKIIWESRSMASVLFIYTKGTDGHWYVLANKRGHGCPDYQGYWCCPCGYLDYNETLRNAAVRECQEETGVKVNELRVHLYRFNDSPSENRQNVAFIHYTVIENAINYVFSKKENEANEVDEIGWIRIDLLDNFKWAFGHYDIITEVFNKRVNLPLWKRVILNLYEKYLAPNDNYCHGRV